MKYSKYIALIASMLLSSTVLADDTGVGGADPDSIPPDISTESAESTDTWWNDLLERFGFEAQDDTGHGTD